ncbi:MAG: ankyrin repeat domain-containing protein [Bacteroidales bacterium]|nr:ankyrin repeat domain-containing protein [Bacteroidales bacterium]
MRYIATITFLLFTISIITAQPKEQKDSLDYALMDAAWNGNADSVIYLIKSGADVNVKNDYSQETPLIYAAQQGHLDVVKILLHNGADPDVNPRNEEEALIRAIAMGYLEVAEEIVRYGGDVNQRGKLEKTALHYAAAFGYYYIADMLIYYNADINATARYDVTPLMLSISAGYPAISELLIRKKAKLNMTDSEGYSALMLASKYGFHKLTGLMVEKGAKINLKTQSNSTALTFAIQYNHVAVADTLIKHGAEVNHKINDPITLLTLAKSLGNDSIRNLLSDHGAKQNLIPYNDIVLFRYSISGNTDDALFGTHLGFHEVKSNTNVTLGFSTRYFAKRVIEQQSSNLYYQYWERRYLIPLTIDKLFSFSKKYQNKYALFAGIKGYYTWGRYRGVIQKPNDNFGISPRFGFYWKANRDFGMSLHYEYFDLNQETVSPHRVVLNLILHFSTDSELKAESKAEEIYKY